MLERVSVPQNSRFVSNIPGIIHRWTIGNAVDHFLTSKNVYASA